METTEIKKPDGYCEWKKCGGKGNRETKVKRKARMIVEAEGVKWLVCESCADFAVRELRENGLNVEKHPI